MTGELGAGCTSCMLAAELRLNSGGHQRWCSAGRALRSDANHGGRRWQAGALTHPLQRAVVFSFSPSPSPERQSEVSLSSRGASIRGEDRLSHWPAALAELFLHTRKMTGVWSFALDSDAARRANQCAETTCPPLAGSESQSTLQSFVTSHLRKAATRRLRTEPQRRHQT